MTIFGESVGGQNVLTLLASPLAQGLFHRAIAQSPVAETFSIEQAVNWSDDAQPGHGDSALEVTARLWVAEGRARDRDGAKEQLANLPAADIAAFLHALSPARLLAAFTPGSAGIYRGPRPIRDGVVLPREPLAEVFAGDQWNRVPVILGSNRDEFKTFSADKPEYSRLLLGKLPMLRDRRAYQVEMKYLSLAWKALYVDAPADAMLAGGHTEVWTYRFDWDEAPAVPFVRPDLLLGADAFSYGTRCSQAMATHPSTRFGVANSAVRCQPPDSGQALKFEYALPLRWVATRLNGSLSMLCRSDAVALLELASEVRLR